MSIVPLLMQIMESKKEEERPRPDSYSHQHSDYIGASCSYIGGVPAQGFTGVPNSPELEALQSRLADAMKLVDELDVLNQDAIDLINVSQRDVLYSLQAMRSKLQQFKQGGK